MKNEYFGTLENIMPTLPSKSVRMIFCDFPYNTTKILWDKNIIDLEIFWKEANRILLDNGIVIATCQFPFTAILAMSNIKKLRYDWVYQKIHPTGHLNAKRMPMKAHENILVFYNKLPLYNPQKTQGHKRKVSSKKHKEAMKSIDSAIYNKGQKPTNYDSTERYPLSVQVFSSDKQKLNINNTQKPEALLEYLIKTYTNEGDVILDPTRGSNTTGVVSDKLNRIYWGIESDEEQYKKGIERRKINLEK